MESWQDRITPTCDCKEGRLKVTMASCDARLETSGRRFRRRGSSQLYHSALEKRDAGVDMKITLSKWESRRAHIGGGSETYITSHFTRFVDRVKQWGNGSSEEVGWQEEPVKKGVVYYMDDDRCAALCVERLGYSEVLVR